MIFLTDDELFGIRVTPLEGQQHPLSRFWLLVGGGWRGDGEPAIVWSSLRDLLSVEEVDDPRLDPTVRTGSEIRDTLFDIAEASEASILDRSHDGAADADERLYDRVLLQLGEPFDDWVAYGYIHGDDVVIVLSPARDDATGEVLMAVVPRSTYLSLAELALRYHDTVHRHGAGDSEGS